MARFVLKFRAVASEQVRRVHAYLLLPCPTSCPNCLVFAGEVRKQVKGKFLEHRCPHVAVAVAVAACCCGTACITIACRCGWQGLHSLENPEVYGVEHRVKVLSELVRGALLHP